MRRNIESISDLTGFAKSLELPIEECVRLENLALAELLNNPDQYSWDGSQFAMYGDVGTING